MKCEVNKKLFVHMETAFWMAEYSSFWKTPPEAFLCRQLKLIICEVCRGVRVRVRVEPHY